jgi:hypothetical protein
MISATITVHFFIVILFFFNGLPLNGPQQVVCGAASFLFVLARAIIRLDTLKDAWYK